MSAVLPREIISQLEKFSFEVGEWIPRHLRNNESLLAFGDFSGKTLHSLLSEMTTKELFSFAGTLIKLGAPKLSLAIYESFLSALTLSEKNEEIAASDDLTSQQFGYISERALGRFQSAYERLQHIRTLPKGEGFYDKQLRGYFPFDHRASEDKSAQDVKENHESLWADAGDAIKRSLESGDSLNSILIKHNLQVSRRPLSKVVTSFASNRLIADNQNIFYTNNGFPLFKPAINGEGYSLISNVHPLPVFLKGVISGDVENIVELGSGWGRNLLFLASSLGRRARDINFYFLEYSQSGVDASSDLSKELEVPMGRSVSLRFDYTKGLPEEVKILKGKTVFFSCFSVEQVPEIGVRFFEDMSQLPFEFQVFNFEPIGWQTVAAFVAAREKKNREFFERLAIEREFDGASQVDVTQALNSYRMSYNYDFVGNLRAFHHQKIINFEDLSKYHSPPNDIHNPGTLAIWSNRF